MMSYVMQWVLMCRYSECFAEYCRLSYAKPWLMQNYLIYLFLLFFSYYLFQKWLIFATRSGHGGIRLTPWHQRQRHRGKAYCFLFVLETVILFSKWQVLAHHRHNLWNYKISLVYFSPRPLPFNLSTGDMWRITKT